MLAPLHVHLPDESATRVLGEQLAAVIQPGMSIDLCGDLGSGKTTLARGIARGLGFTGPIKSPSYALVEPYESSRLSFYHFDFFRFQSATEWEESGFRECFNERSVCVIEWPERAAGLLPAPDIRVRLSTPPRGGRDAAIDAETESGRWCLSELTHMRSAR